MKTKDVTIKGLHSPATGNHRGQAEVTTVRHMIVYRLRTEEGLSYREIAQQVGGISHVTAARDCLKAIKEINKPNIERIEIARAKENAKLDLLEKPLFEKIETVMTEKGKEIEATDLQTINSILKLMQRRAALNGYDVTPDEIKVSFTNIVVNQVKKQAESLTEAELVARAQEIMSKYQPKQIEAPQTESKKV